ncbi:MAG TPA: hypothetical protein VER37_04525, partial [Thermomicrobiales bacterium]|nr:hypothetical protein [Thermomicrobiales bacterium]
MSVVQGGIMMDLALSLGPQPRRDEYGLRINHAKLRRSEMHFDVPDLAVIPAGLIRALRATPGSLDAYAAPLSLV